MFRSGTTLLGRVLHAHGKIAVASDGIFPFFKYLRNRIAQKNNLILRDEFDEPLFDFYFDPEHRKLYEAIQHASLEEEISKDDLKELKGHIKRWCTDSDQYSPKLYPFVDRLKARTFKDLYKGLLEIMKEAYADENTEIVGPKEVWVGEFIPAIYRSMPDTNFIYMIRDPRSVFASKSHMHDGKYPWLFMARQWRKQATLGYLYNTSEAFKGKVLLLYYEELIKNPEKTTHKICDFLNIDWDENMVRPDTYVNGRGNAWYQNTAYRDIDISGKRGFDTASVTRWEKSLDEKEVRLIEYLCGPEMEFLGYKLKYDINEANIRKLVMDLPIIPDNELAGWIRKFENNTYEYLAMELERERIRYDLLKSKSDIDMQKSGALIDLCFLDRRQYLHMITK